MAKIALFLQDDELKTEMTSELERAEYAFELAQNANDLMEICRKQTPPSIVYLDAFCEGVNVTDTVLKLRECNEDIVIITVTPERILDSLDELDDFEAGDDIGLDDVTLYRSDDEDDDIFDDVDKYFLYIEQLQEFGADQHIEWPMPARTFIQGLRRYLEEPYRVLLVNEDNLFQSMQERMLIREDFLVDCHRNVLEAIKAYRWGKIPYDIVLTDIVMSGKRGTELIKEIRQQDDYTPILAYTLLPEISESRDKYIQQLIDLGADAILPPNMEPEEFIEEIYEHLEPDEEFLEEVEEMQQKFLDLLDDTAWLDDGFGYLEDDDDPEKDS